MQLPIGTLVKMSAFGALLLGAAAALAGTTQNVVLIVSDGLRWQEIFTGADPALLNDKEGGSWLGLPELRKRYWREKADARRAALFSFLWGNAGQQGEIYGNTPK